MANILIAAGAEGSARLRKILEPSHELLFARTVQEALDAARKCDVMVCGLEFDESRMFDFLRTMNADAELRKKPRVCVRFFATNTPDKVIGGLEVAARAVGANSLVDLPALETELGEKGANARILDAVDSAVSDHPG